MEIGKLKKRFNTIYTHFHYFGFGELFSLTLVEVFGDRFWPFREKMILLFLKRNFSDIIEKYKDSESPTDTISGDAPIWTFWAQGEENMPPIAKKCLECARKNANGRKVMLLDMHSVRNYIDLPETIYILFRKNKIGMAHFSDIVRCALLAKYGGIWLDACILLTRPFDKFEKSFYTIPGHFRTRCFSRKWTCGVQGSVPKNPFHSFVRDALISYHQKELPLFDYFLLDYMMYLAYVEIPAVKNMVDNAQKDQTDFHFISRNRDRIFAKHEVEQCFNANILMRASYRWVPTKPQNSLYWYIFNM